MEGNDCQRYISVHHSRQHKRNQNISKMDVLDNRDLNDTDVHQLHCSDHQCSLKEVKDGSHSLFDSSEGTFLRNGFLCTQVVIALDSRRHCYSCSTSLECNVIGHIQRTGSRDILCHLNNFAAPYISIRSTPSVERRGSHDRIYTCDQA
ncbi:hypothetical protein Q1695_010989 [Nippostrongylus brasiliensis]|nr:hypothetical protein Q1695_010989 [Nippostrongylus brasiliensis]